MSDTKIIRVDSSLINVFGNIGRDFAEKIKKEYNLKNLFVSDVLASQLLAGKYSGKTSFRFKIKKTSLNNGILILI